MQIIPLPNGDFTVRIRGMGTGAGDVDPLLVIDDSPVATGRLSLTLATIHPGEIARIDVLKGGASRPCTAYAAPTV